jgi:hypothetical protein
MRRRMIRVLKFILSRHEWYWILKDKLSRSRFYLGSKTFSLNWKVKSLNRKLKHLFDITRISIPDILFSLLCISSVYFIPYLIWNVDFRDENNLYSSYDSILATVAGVGGVVIGLFYAAIVSLGTSIYAKLPAEAKDALYKEPVGSIFVRFLSYLTFFCITLLFLRFFGFEKSSLAINIVLIMTGVAIFGMVKLGSRLFYLTDPTILADSSLRILYDVFELSKVGRFNSSNIHFQKHYWKLADTSIRTIHLLKDVALKEEHLSSESLLQLSSECSKTIIKYLETKKSIPTDSLWFATSYKHKKWFHVPNISIETSDSMGFLTPDEVKDKLWLEKKLLRVPIECIEVNLKNKNFEIVNSCLSNVGQLVIALVENYEASLAITVIEEVELLILNYLSLDNLGDDELLLSLSIVDNMGFIKTNLILAVNKVLDNVKGDFISAEMRKIDWKKEKSIYRTKFPSFMHERLKYLVEKIQFEYDVEGKRISPNWYIENLLLQVYLERICKVNDEVITFILNQPKILKNHECYAKYYKTKSGILFISASFDRYLEHSSKLILLLNNFVSVWEASADKNKIDGLKWPKFDLNIFKDEVKEWPVGLLDEMSTLSSKLTEWTYSDNFPDYTGKFLHFTGNFIVNNLINVGKLSQKSYASYFYSSLRMFDILRVPEKEDPEWLIKNKLQLAVAPIIELIAISGYVYISSNYYEKPELWDIVKKCWDNYFSDDDEERIRQLKQIEAILKIPDTAFGVIPHRDFHRGKWHQQFINFLRENVEVKSEWYQPEGAKGYQERFIVSHNSAEVRTYMKGNEGYKDYEGEDVFLDVYFSKICEELDLEIEFSHKYGDFNRDLQREKANEEEE